MDDYTLAFVPSSNGSVSIPQLYDANNNGPITNLDYFNLCWLSPNYDESHMGVYGNYWLTGSGCFYQDARANLRRLKNIYRAGD